MPGVNLTSIKSDKFKTGSLSINLIGSLRAETASASALIPQLLCRGCEDYPDMESIAAALDDLYGARIEPLVRKKGELHITGLYTDFPDDRYISGESGFLSKTAALAFKILLSPVMRNGALREDYVESEKQKLIDDIRAGINDKRTYAHSRLLEEMCPDEAYRIDKLGTEADASAISTSWLTGHYRDMIDNSNIELLYCGSQDHSRVEATLTAYLKDARTRTVPALPETEVILRPSTDSPRVAEQTLDVSQGKMALGFRLGETMRNPDYPALMVFNAVYGSGFTSKLFKNVREKLALCYYVGSMIDKQKGVMIVSSGVDKENFNVARDEIMLALGSMKKGDISELEMNSAKRSIITSVEGSMDTPSGLLELYFDSAVSPVRYDPLKLCSLVESVNLDRVVETASSVELDTVYLLSGEESNNAK